MLRVGLELGSSRSLSLNIASCCARGKESSRGLHLDVTHVTSTYNLLTRTSHVVPASCKGSRKHRHTVCLERERELEIVGEDSNIYYSGHVKTTLPFPW